MTLQSQLDVIRTRELEKTPPTEQQILREAQAYLRRTGAGANALDVGDRAPDFELPDTDGRIVSLDAVRARGPVILDFFRGGWCPFCSLELRAYQQLVESIEHAGASLLAISPELPVHLQKTVEENELTFPVLSDANAHVARQYGLVYTVPEVLRPIYVAFGLDLPERQGRGELELPVPATYLVDRDGTIRRAFLELDVSRRGEPEYFIAGLHELRHGEDRGPV